MSVKESIDLLTGGEKLLLIYWLEERLKNCVRIANTKTGRDKGGWDEDAAYFKLAIRAIKGML